MAKKIIIIGGGPAGMMAAIRAAQCKAEVTLLEKNATLGKKLLITGKGRCNLTNACELEEFLARFGRQGSFLRDAFKIFFYPELMDFFQQRGLPLKIERQQRIFPETDLSKSVLSVLVKELEKLNINVKCNSEVAEILHEVGHVSGVKLSSGKVINADAVIVTTGGKTYHRTGSTGDGYVWAKQFGHTIKNPQPALVPLEIEELYSKEWEGLALKNIKIIFQSGKRKLETPIGELMVTEKGISGPLVLTYSGNIVDWLEQKKLVLALIDLKPGLSEEQLNQRFTKNFKESPKKTIKVILQEFLPKRMIELFLSICQVNAEKRSVEISNKDKLALVKNFKALLFTIKKAKSLETGMVTRGGVLLKEIDPKTMMSKKMNKLFFAGEILDFDGDTGGFNLQAAFSTGYLAGQASAKS